MQALELGRERFLALAFEDAEAPGGEVEPGEAEALAVGHDRREQVLAPGIEQAHRP